MRNTREIGQMLTCLPYKVNFMEAILTVNRYSANSAFVYIQLSQLIYYMKIMSKMQDIKLI